MGRLALALAGIAVPAVLFAAAPARAAEAPAEIALTIENHKFQPDEIRVKAGKPFVLVVTNNDATPEEFESKSLRLEKVIPAGKTLRLRVPALKAGTYDFIGEYNEKKHGTKGWIIAE